MSQYYGTFVTCLSPGILSGLSNKLILYNSFRWSPCILFSNSFYVQDPTGETRIQANRYSDIYLQSNKFQGKENFNFLLQVLNNQSDWDPGVITHFNFKSSGSTRDTWPQFLIPNLRQYQTWLKKHQSNSHVSKSAFLCLSSHYHEMRTVGKATCLHSIWLTHM